jgi:mono/diheme cytochrome c family protein
MTLRRSGAAVAILALSLSGVAADAVAENIGGETDYMVACAACHGRSGKGDGPVAAELRRAPPDLTLLAKNNGGVFPTAIVEAIIDGRKSLRAHGSYDMPVWGSVFSQLQPDKAQSRIRNIVEYIRVIQAQ